MMRQLASRLEKLELSASVAGRPTSENQDYCSRLRRLVELSGTDLPTHPLSERRVDGGG
jgi:hypothetical protein